MKTISEVLDTELSLTIKTNGVETTAPLLDPLRIEIDGGYETVEVDDFKIEEHHGTMIDGVWVFQCDNFYQWKHHATDQGWLFYQKAKK